MTAFAGGRAVRLPEREYFELALAGVEAAQRRAWVCMFLCDPRPHRDLEGQVLELLLALAARSQAGVDVRVLTSASARTADLDAANLAAGMFLQAYRVPHRRVFEHAGDARRGTHAKFFLCDEVAVAGSQNWTDDAFRLNVEDAVLLSGEPVALLAAEFQRLWADGRGMPRT